MKELVIVSGKGGTGKTSLVASFAALAANRAVLADVDVDAADLHLILQPRIVHEHSFTGGDKARIDPARCRACGQCRTLCRFDAIHNDGAGSALASHTYRIDQLACEGCGVCAYFCPMQAIAMVPAVCGRWFVSETRFGTLVHARLYPGAENSGKLVTRIRQEARELAAAGGLKLVLCDGSPGIGCPVIASLTGASLALVVTEPTASGMHDFRRIAELLGRLDVPALMVVNKADLNEPVAEELEQAARRCGIRPVGRIPYDTSVTRAQVAGQTVVEASSHAAAQAIHRVWHEVEGWIERAATSGTRVVPLESLVMAGDAAQPSRSA